MTVFKPGDRIVYPDSGAKGTIASWVDDGYCTVRYDGATQDDVEHPSNIRPLVQHVCGNCGKNDNLEFAELTFSYHKIIQNDENGLVIDGEVSVDLQPERGQPGYVPAVPENDSSVGNGLFIHCNDCGSTLPIPHDLDFEYT